MFNARHFQEVSYLVQRSDGRSNLNIIVTFLAVNKIYLIGEPYALKY